MNDECPNCGHEFIEGEQIYTCRVCGVDCCSHCSHTTDRYETACDTCVFEGVAGQAIDGWND